VCRRDLPLPVSHRAVRQVMKRLAAFVLNATLLAIIFLASACRAGLAPTLHLNERREGVLRQSDAIRGELPRGRENRWRFAGRAGQRLTITVESYEFEPYLMLLDPQQHPIASSNQGFAGARMQTTLTDGGGYTVVVCGANADQFGTYWVGLGEGADESDGAPLDMETYYRQAMAWAAQSGSRRACTWASLAMAQSDRHRRQWQSAEAYYNSARAAAEADDFAYGQWAAALEGGRLFARRRRYEQAVSEFQRALQLSKSLQSGREAETLALTGLGELYHAMAKADLAKFYFESAARQAEEALPATRVALYTALNSWLSSQDKEKAIGYAETSYGLCGGLDPALELKALYALAGTYLFMQPGKSEEGLRLAQEMRRRAARLGLPDEEAEAISLISISQYAAHHIEEMIRLAGEALERADPADENPTPRRVALQLRADGEMLRGNYDAALQSCLEALRLVEHAWAEEKIEELRRELLSQSRAICTQIIRNLYALNERHPSREYARQAFDYAERSRSRSLLEQLPGVEPPTANDRQALGRDREILDKLSQVRGQLVLLRASSTLSRDTMHRLQEQRANLLAEHLQLQAEVRQAIRDSYHAAHVSPLTAEEAQKKLGEHYPNSAILNYQLGIQASFLIVSTPAGTHFFKLPDWHTIARAVQDWQVQVQSQLRATPPDDAALRRYHEAAHRLYQFLIEPAAKVVGTRDLIIIPSDALCQVAYEALTVNEAVGPAASDRPRYLIEQRAISYAPSASILFEIAGQGRAAATMQMLLLGDAGVETAAHETATALNERLPAARREVIEIARLARQHHISPTILLGAQADERAFKSRDLSVFRFIHIATHGVSDRQDGDASALTLAPSAEGGEDGVLTGMEIAKLRLKAELVVLSGCETSGGEKGGAEGIVGLNRAFQIAGARCICGSLWPVEDAATERLMRAFYQALFVDRQSKAQALRTAKLKMLNAGAPPSRWAAFILAGPPR
jgi:CHAT domain-containing protein